MVISGNAWLGLVARCGGFWLVLTGLPVLLQFAAAAILRERLARAVLQAGHPRRVRSSIRGWHGLLHPTTQTPTSILIPDS